MLRFFFPALALVSVLAVVQPAFADPSTVPASDLVQAAAATDQVSPEAAMSWSSDAATPARPAQGSASMPLRLGSVGVSDGIVANVKRVAVPSRANAGSCRPGALPAP